MTTYDDLGGLVCRHSDKQSPTAQLPYQAISQGCPLAKIVEVIYE